MPDFDRSPDGLAFSQAVQEMQRRFGSRKFYESAEWPIDIPRDLEQFISRQRSLFIATASAAGQPYIQHRGGAPGFLKVLDSRRLAMPDLRGNGQYITAGNLSENSAIVLFLIDYATRTRIKIWGKAQRIEGNADLISRVCALGAPATAAVLSIDVEAWDANCPQHIPFRMEMEEVEQQLAARDRRIAELERELTDYRERFPVWDGCGDDLWD